MLIFSDLYLLLVRVLLLRPGTAGLAAQPQPLGHGGLPGLASAVLTAAAEAGGCVEVRDRGLGPGEHLIHNQRLGRETPQT